MTIRDLPIRKALPALDEAAEEARVEPAVGAATPTRRCARTSVGRSCSALELLVAADIINTVAVEPTLESIAVLAGIVAIRTFLSFSLELEIEGKWPWQTRRQGD